MRTVKIVSLIACSTLLLLITSGCSGKNGKRITPIGGWRGSAPGGDSGAPKASSGTGMDTSLSGGNSAPVAPSPTFIERPVVVGPGGGALSADEYEGMLKDTVMFSGNTVFFDLDKATIKKAEQKKIDEVAAYLKSSGASANKMLVEGHCDERGTEEYNRALGERRALAVREYLVRAGVGSDRVFTRSYGEDRPADSGHDEAAWAKNRRGEFIVLKPKPLN